jgi:hypothetical protein
MLLSLALSLEINHFYQLRVPVMLCFCFSVFLPILIYIFELNNKYMITYLILLSIVPITLLAIWIKKWNPMRWFGDLSNWILYYDGSKERYVMHYATFVMLMTVFLSDIIFYIITKKQFTKIILSAVLVIALILLSVYRVEIYKIVIGICLFYSLTTLLEAYGMVNTKRTGKQDAILFLLPICLILSVTSVCLPSKEEPIQWNWVKNLYQSAKEQIVVWRMDYDYYFGNNNSEYVVNLSGYSEDNAKLNSSKQVIKDNRVALKVSSYTKTRPIYLIGSVNDIYTGNSWEKSREDYIEGEEEYLLDYYELYYALARQDIETLEENSFVERRTLDVNYHFIKTKSFFHPLKTVDFKIISHYNKLLTESSNITFKKARGKGTAYKNTFYDLNLGGKAFIQMLRNADNFSYNDKIVLNENTQNYLKSNIFKGDNVKAFDKQENIFEQLKERADLIDSKYTVLPKELPERVRILAVEITAGCDTNYDKLKALEEYLQSYTYNLQVKMTPEGQDFVDYFLFDSKEGYCTSFATSMAVLARCIGIPTRYVEGFVINFDKEDSDGKYSVLNSQAHAWAEAYIEGVGWIPFEATTSFGNNRYPVWPEVNPAGTPVVIPETVMNEMYPQVTPSIAPMKDVEPIQEEKHIGNGILIFLFAVAMFSISIMGYYSYLKYQRKKEYKKADDSRKMYMQFLRILDLLKREGYELEQQETILMLSKRVKNDFSYSQVTFPVVAKVFMQYRYAEMKVTPKDLELVVIYQEGLADKKKQEQKWFQLWWEDFVFLMKHKNS